MKKIVIYVILIFTYTVCTARSPVSIALKLFFIRCILFLQTVFPLFFSLFFRRRFFKHVLSYYCKVSYRTVRVRYNWHYSRVLNFSIHKNLSETV